MMKRRTGNQRCNIWACDPVREESRFIAMIYLVFRARFLSFGLILVLVVVLSVNGGCEKKTAPTRKDISNHLSYLKSKFEANPVQNAPDLDEIIASLQSDSAFTRTYACEMLRELGKDARKAIPSLVKVLHGKDEEVRRETARALGEIVTDEKEAIDGLVACVKSLDEASARIALESLGKIGVKNQEVVAALEAASRSDSEVTADVAKRALKNLGIE